MKSCDNPLGCACYEANGYSLTDCEYFVGIDSQQDIIEDDTPDWVYDAQAFGHNQTFTKSGTFENLTQDSIPKEIKLRMKADREKAQNK